MEALWIASIPDRKDPSMFDWLYTVLRPAQEYFTYMETSGLQNLDLCLALRAFKQGGIFVVPHLL
jgi:hypothetical protein